MKTMILFAALALGSATASAQKTETRNINGFTSVNVQNGIEVQYTQGTVESVTIEYKDTNVKSDLVTDCYGSELRIYAKDHGDAKGAKVYITQKGLSSITVGTGAKLNIIGKLDAKDLKITLATGGVLEGTVSCTGTCSLDARTGAVAKAAITAHKFNGDVTGAATVKLEGSAADADVYCSGATLLAGKFCAAKAGIVAKNASAVLINIKDAVKADADESSAITYYGAPDKITVAENSYAVRRR